MDYCYACRRHLNGAYSCPGCGTPADQLKLPQAGETAQLPPVVDDEDGPGAAPDPGGGTSRGMRRGRSRGRQQRVAVYGVGLVAGAGALAMLSMAALSGGDADGGTSPSPPVVNATRAQPAGTSAPPQASGSAEPHTEAPTSTAHHTPAKTATP